MDLVAPAVANYVGAWKLLSAALATGAVGGDDDLVFCATGSPLAVFNQAFVVGDLDPDDVLRRAREFFGAHDDVPFIVRASHARFAPLRDRAASYGLRDGAYSPLMVLHPVGTVPPPPASDDIRVVSDAAGLAVHRNVVASGFGAPLSIVEQLLAGSLVSSDWFRAFVVSVDGVAVSTAALIEAGGVAGIYNVATVAQYRRRGLGEAATWAAVAEGARRGHTLATLQASDMGRPIYERMGFRHVDTWRYVTT